VPGRHTPAAERLVPIYTGRPARVLAHHRRLAPAIDHVR
jgi:hypothetical protein